jgi:hypothetical protein
MAEIRLIFLSLFFTLFSTALAAQTIEISGSVVGVGDVQNIHVINKSLNKFTTTNKMGGFTIEVRVLDTLVFSSIRYKLKAIQVKQEHIDEKRITVLLEENVNELDQVVVGKVLTGQLDSDVNNTENDRDINFYDVGIPGYKGKPKTQSERRLHEADAGKAFNLREVLTLKEPPRINVNKILNKISGRTKELKERVRKESNTKLLNKIKDEIADDFFRTYTLAEELRIDFLYFCSDDPAFEERCEGKSNIEVFEFLAEKMTQYKANLKEVEGKN